MEECLDGVGKLLKTMKIVDVIPFLLSPDTLESLYSKIKFNSDEDVLCIYMEDEINIKSDVYFFTIEETDDDIIFQRNGVKYVQLLPVDYAIELIESDLDLKDNGYSNLQIAERLVKYALRDA